MKKREEYLQPWKEIAIVITMWFIILEDVVEKDALTL